MKLIKERQGLEVLHQIKGQILIVNTDCLLHSKRVLKEKGSLTQAPQAGGCISDLLTLY